MSRVDNCAGDEGVENDNGNAVAASSDDNRQPEIDVHGHLPSGSDTSAVPQVDVNMGAGSGPGSVGSGGSTSNIIPGLTVTGKKPPKVTTPPLPFYPSFGQPTFGLPSLYLPSGGAQGKSNQSPQQCRASLEPWVQAGAGAAGGAVSGALVGGPAGAFAGAAAGGVTGLVTGYLSGAGAPDWFAGAIGAPVGAVSTAFAAQAFTAEGATASGMLFAGYGGHSAELSLAPQAQQQEQALAVSRELLVLRKLGPLVWRGPGNLQSS